MFTGRIAHLLTLAISSEPLIPDLIKRPGSRREHPCFLFSTNE
jgi:hypothetical protein